MNAETGMPGVLYEFEALMQVRATDPEQAREKAEQAASRLFDPVFWGTRLVVPEGEPRIVPEAGGMNEADGLRG